MNVERNLNKENSTLVETEVINNTPFHVVKQNEEWFIVMGKQMISTKYKTKEEAIDSIERDKWFIIMTIATMVFETLTKEPKGY